MSYNSRGGQRYFHMWGGKPHQEQQDDLDQESGEEPPQGASASNNGSTANQRPEEYWDFTGGEPRRKPIVLPDDIYGRPPENEIKYAHPTLNYALAKEDELYTCPYYGHQVRRAIMGNHMTKCRNFYQSQMVRNPDLEEYLICNFNWFHHVPESEYRDHLRDCPDAQKHVRNLSDFDAEPQGKDADEEDSREETEDPNAPRPIPSITDAEQLTITEEDRTGRKPRRHSMNRGDSESMTSTEVSEASSFMSLASEKIFANTSRPGQHEEDSDRPPSPIGSAIARRREPDREQWRSSSRSRMRANPTASVVNGGAHVYQIPPGLSKAQRKTFRQRNNALYTTQKARSVPGSSSTVNNRATLPEVQEEEDEYFPPYEEVQQRTSNAYPARY